MGSQKAEVRRQKLKPGMESHQIACRSEKRGLTFSRTSKSYDKVDCSLLSLWAGRPCAGSFREIRESVNSNSVMWQTYIFGMHWMHRGEMYYDELPAGSKDEAWDYFNDQKRDDVALIRVELIGPDEPGVREYARSPISPFDPLRARRRTDKDEDAR